MMLLAGMLDETLLTLALEIAIWTTVEHKVQDVLAGPRVFGFDHRWLPIAFVLVLRTGSGFRFSTLL